MWELPVGFIQYDDFLASGRQRNLLLRKGLDAVSHHVYAALVRCVQFQHCLFVGIPEQRAREA